LQRARQRFLHHVFGQGKMPDAKNARQRGHHFSRLVAKEVFDRLSDTWRILMLFVRLTHVMPRLLVA
jgi:hypothetical protein